MAALRSLQKWNCPARKMIANNNAKIRIRDESRYM
jgi:hypothetical protein